MKTSLKRRTLAAVISIPILILSSCLPEENERALLEKGAWLIDRGDYEEAITLLETPALLASREGQKLLISAYLGSIGVNFERVGEIAQRAMKSRLSTRFVINEFVSLFYLSDRDLLEKRLWRARQAAYLSSYHKFPVSDFMSHCALMGVIFAKASGDGVFTVNDLDQTHLTDPMATLIVESSLHALEILDTFTMSREMRRYVDEMKRFVEGREQSARELRRLLKYYLS